MLLNVAAKVRSAWSFKGALTFECNITFDDPSCGRSCDGPISIMPGNAKRLASGATARPARAAAATAVTPPPPNAPPNRPPPRDASLAQGANGNRAPPARRSQRREPQRFPAMPLESRRGEPAEFIFGQFFPASPAAFLPHHHRIQFTSVERIQQCPRKTDQIGRASCRG